MAGFAVLMAIAIIIYMMPSESSKPKKKKKEPVPASQEQLRLVPEKDWKAIAERWEKNNNALLGDLEKLKMQEKKLLKDAEETKGKYKEIVDKLALEKSWREKEQVNLDKSKGHEKDLKEQIIRTEKDLEREHSERLRLEREGQELKIKHDGAVEERRTLSTKAASLETTLTAAQKEIKELKVTNAQLKEKREDIQWVAKSAYDELKTELERLKKTNGA